MKNSTPIVLQKPAFDELSALALTDPAGFEELRLALIERVISTPGSNVSQLVRLQNRLDSGGAAATPAYFSCLLLSEWLGESYQKLSRQLTAARGDEAADMRSAQDIH